MMKIINRGTNLQGWTKDVILYLATNGYTEGHIFNELKDSCPGSLIIPLSGSDYQHQNFLVNPNIHTACDSHLHLIMVITSS